MNIGQFVGRRSIEGRACAYAEVSNVDGYWTVDGDADDIMAEASAI